MPARLASILLLCITGMAFLLPKNVSGQDALYLVNAETTIRKISFKFPEGQPTFEPDQLKLQLVSTAPTFWRKLDRLNPFKRAETFPFDPIELQKDVVRLRQFYQRNGFPSPRISYSNSQFDSEENRIHVIFNVWEGRPLFIREVEIVSTDSLKPDIQVPTSLSRPWNRFQTQVEQSINQRFTEIERLRIQDQITSWFKNHGFAFATVRAETQLDDANFEARLKYIVDAGPVGYFTGVDVEGNETVSQQILLRELPFEIGDRFSSAKLREGQQQLFGLNLFRVALADVPEQPVDSTVQVRIRVNEAKSRFISAETGYSRQEGIGLEGEWTHRNFLGSARNLTINLRANTGLLGSSGGLTEDNVVGKLPARLFRTSVSLRQPYVFTTRLSGIFSPFIEFQNDPQLPASREFLDINRREYGLNATLIYEVLPFRPVSLQYTLSQSLSRFDTASSLTLEERDIYSKSILGISATFGRTDNYLNPRKGYLIKPYIETAGRLFASGVQYNKLGLEIAGYIPITRRLMLSNRIFAGHLWTFGNSKAALADRICIEDASLSGFATNECQIYENRFDPIFFYAGGSNDVRGWDFQLLGPKFARADTLRSDGAVVLDENGNPVLDNFFYERTGGTGKLIGNIEARMRIPGFGPAWQGATFFDFGQVTNGKLRGKDFRYNVGAGIRYQTIVGFIRVDLAYKLNPTDADLTDPRDAFLFENGLITEPPDKKFLRRFGLHISIGQAF